MTNSCYLMCDLDFDLMTLALDQDITVAYVLIINEANTSFGLKLLSGNTDRHTDMCEIVRLPALSGGNNASLEPLILHCMHLGTCS